MIAPARTAWVGKDPTIEVAVGIDEVQLLETLRLWEAWTEERGLKLDRQLWCRYVHARISAGNYLPIVAWDGDIGVGMAEMGLLIDPFTGRLSAHGDHLYVLPEYRQEGVMKKIYDTGEALVKIFGAEDHYIPVDLEHADFLIPFYRSHGFRPYAMTFHREA